jgi:molybdate transport system ATP-binding protein
VARLELRVRLARGGFDLRVEQALELAGITSLFGPSGSGKTTLLRIIAGLETAAQGDVAFDGQVWQSAGGGKFLPAHRRCVGLVFQDARLFPHLSVAGNLDYGRRRAPADQAGPGLNSVVDALDLGSLLDRPPATLSGGERQRVAIGRTLLARPRLLLMDEPLASLDVARRHELLPHIEALPARFGVPVIYVTHAIDEVARLADQVAVLAAGRMAACGDTASILERLDITPLTGRQEAGVVLHARVLRHDDSVALTEVAIGGQRLTLPALTRAPGTQIRLRVRARDVALATRRPAGISIRNVLDATILEIGSGDGSPFAEILLDLGGDHLRARVTRASVRDLALAPGQQVFALIKSIALDGEPLASEI